MPPHTFYEAVYRVARTIPKGRVMTYGQIATILGQPRAARAVGYAMLASDPAKDVPWQRVINKHGRISDGGDPQRPALQRAMLEKEGVKFDASDACDLEQYRWTPPDPERFEIALSRDLPFR